MRSAVFLGAAAAGAAAQSISDAPSPTTSADTSECDAAFSEVVTASIVGEIVYPFDGPEEDLAISYMKGLFYNTEDPCEPPVVTDAAVAEPFSEWFTSYTDYLSDNIRLYRTLYAGCWDVPAFLEGYPVTHMCSDFAIGVTSGIGATTEAGESTTTTTTATSATGTGATESESAASSGNDASGSETSSQSPEETGGAGNNDGGDSEGQNENGNDGDDDSAAARGVGSITAAAGVAAACLLLAQLN